MAIDYDLVLDGLHTDVEVNPSSARAISSLFYTTSSSVETDSEKLYSRFFELASRRIRSTRFTDCAHLFTFLRRLTRHVDPDYLSSSSYYLPDTTLSTLPKIESEWAEFTGARVVTLFKQEVISSLPVWTPIYLLSNETASRLPLQSLWEDAQVVRLFSELRKLLVDPPLERQPMHLGDRRRLRLHTITFRLFYIQRLDTGGQPARKLRLQLLCHFFFSGSDDDDEASMAFGIEVVDIHNVNREKYETKWQNWHGSSISAPTASPLGSEEHSHHRQPHYRNRELRSRFNCNGRRQCTRMAYSRRSRRCRSRFDYRLYHRRW